MKVQFSLTDIEHLKGELTRLLPAIKSSHRVEAMARGLGWKTNAALRAELARQEQQRNVDDQAFTTYLRHHGFVETKPGALDDAVVRCRLIEREAIRAVSGLLISARVFRGARKMT